MKIEAQLTQTVATKGEEIETDAGTYINDPNPNLTQGRARRPPTWLDDCETAFDIHTEEELLNLVMFGPNIDEDPDIW